MSATRRRQRRDVAALVDCCVRGILQRMTAAGGPAAHEIDEALELAEFVDRELRAMNRVADAAADIVDGFPSDDDERESEERELLLALEGLRKVRRADRSARLVADTECGQKRDSDCHQVTS